MKTILTLAITLALSTSVSAQGGGAGNGAGPHIDKVTLSKTFSGEAGPQRSHINGKLVHWTADRNGKPVAQKSLPNCQSLKKAERKNAVNCFYSIASYGSGGGR